MIQRREGLSFEALQLYRNAFVNVKIVFIDEISMIGSGIFHIINERLKKINPARLAIRRNGYNLLRRFEAVAARERGAHI